MRDEKKIWLMEQYAHKVWTIALCLAQEAARAGQYGKEYAIVAEEARVLANKLFEYTAQARFDISDDSVFNGIIDLAVMMKFLSLNAALEAMHMANISMDFNIPKTMAIFAEELRCIAFMLYELAGKGSNQKPFVIPELASPVDSETAPTEIFLLFAIGGLPLIERVSHIKEIFYPPKAHITGGLFSVRGQGIPIINAYRPLGLSYSAGEPDHDHQSVILVCPDGVENQEEMYAVPIDDLELNALIGTRAGQSVSTKKEHAFADYARDCWEAVGGDQLIFVDWKKFIK